MKHAVFGHRAPRQREGGFTLIELMVGMTLGLLTTLIIAQVIVAADRQRQATVNGSDAQVNGALAMYALSRDLQSAGFGLFSHDGAPGCPVRAKRGSAAELSNLKLVPALRTDDGNGNVQSLRLLSAGASTGSVPMVLTANHAQTASSFAIKAVAQQPLDQDVAKGRPADVMMAIPATWKAANYASPFGSTDVWCTVFEVAANSTNTLSATAIPHVQRDGSANPVADADHTLMPAAGYTTGDYLVDLGTLAIKEYWLDGNNLMMRELQLSGDWGDSQVVAPDIVAMQVLYGKDTLTTISATQPPVIVDTYDTTTPTTADDWKRVLSVRVALVARSGVREKEVVTTSDVYWDVGTAATVKVGATAASACPDNDKRNCLKLTLPRASDADTEWQHYRYKVFDTVVPLRNMIWRAS